MSENILAQGDEVSRKMLSSFISPPLVSTPWGTREASMSILYPLHMRCDGLVDGNRGIDVISEGWDLIDLAIDLTLGTPRRKPDF